LALHFALVEHGKNIAATKKNKTTKALKIITYSRKSFFELVVLMKGYQSYELILLL